MSRTWEITNSNAGPMDLVREQDFILRLRRLQRVGTPHLAINMVLSAIEALAKNRKALENVHLSLKEFARVTNGVYAEMSIGDAFIIWEETADANLLAERLMSVLPVDQADAKGKDTYLLTYHLPSDYTALRERANHYVEVVHATNALGSTAASDVLKTNAAAGPLTAWSVDQIGKLLDEIDIRTYARTQNIYRIDAKGAWHAAGEEYFISFDDLRRERFPKLDLITPEHLFFSLCEMMDQRLLAILTDHPESILNKALHFNLSVATVIGNVFMRFAKSVPRDKRWLLTFEFHRGDLFQDFARTLNAIEVLHREGFKVAVDSITPDMVPYLNLAAFDLDELKINVSGERVAMLEDPKILKAMSTLPAEKLLFFRCDSDRALAIGRKLGVTMFQGWHIDDLAGGKKP